MGKFIFQLAGTIITLAIIGFIGYVVFTRIFHSIDDIESNNIVAVDKTNSKQTNMSASTSDLSLEHNVEHNGMFGMYVYSTQKYHNLKGIRCYTVLYFFDDNGNLLKGKQIKDEDGYLCITSNPIVPESNDITDDHRTFIPYDEFSFPDKGTFYFNCQLTVFIMDNNKKIELASSSISRFHLSY